MSKDEFAELGKDWRCVLLGLKSALYDSNTGLFAYPYHFDRLQRLVEYRPTLGLLYLEVSDFDRIEWLCGWQTMDEILKCLAGELTALQGTAYPATGLLASAGVHGGGFLVFLPENFVGSEPSLEDLEAMARGLSRKVHSAVCHRIPEDLSAEVEVTAGFSLLRCEPVFRMERLIYRAIEEARGAAARSAHRDEQRRGAELRQIIRAGLVETYFQPIVHVNSGAVFGYEALTRGPRGTLFETPKVLFGISDRLRISPILDGVCRRRALRSARGLTAGQKLFVNSLPATLSDPRFAEGEAEAMRWDGAIAASDVVLEITERSGIEDFDSFGRRLEEIRALGFQLAIDDVGTGYSSLQTISEVRPEFLKIDHSLVKGIHESLIKQEIVGSILQLGERIGSQVIAEGIEREEEYEMIREFGVQLGQGYLFGAPGPHPVGAGGPPSERA
ncbi:MAG: EAL domain-containing protein [Acidobacteria bacterium]|nr:EAL domain-containing protein [Acidobacteriota bacterium]